MPRHLPAPLQRLHDPHPLWRRLPTNPRPLRRRIQLYRRIQRHRGVHAVEHLPGPGEGLCAANVYTIWNAGATHVARDLVADYAPDTAVEECLVLVLSAAGAVGECWGEVGCAVDGLGARGASDRVAALSLPCFFFLLIPHKRIMDTWFALLSIPTNTLIKCFRTTRAYSLSAADNHLALHPFVRVSDARADI